MGADRRRARRVGSPIVPLIGLFATLLAARLATNNYDVPVVFSPVIGLAVGAVVMIVLVFLISFIGSLLGRKPARNE